MSSLDGEDSIDGSRVEGVIAGGTDSYRYHGNITWLHVDGDVTIEIETE